MKLRIKVSDRFDKIYHPLQFRAFWNDEGYCYLRVQIMDGKIVFTCAQLLNYYNTSITNAVENVRESALNALIRDGALKIYDQKNIFDLFKSQKRISEEFEILLFDFLNENSVWIEYYHASSSITDDDRYTIVKFEGNSSPTWYSTSKENLDSDFPGLNFSIDEESLANWRNARLSTSTIKKLLKDKNWTMKEVATRWNRSEVWMSKIVNDENRDLYWEDAFKGLPSNGG